MRTPQLGLTPTLRPGLVVGLAAVLIGLASPASASLITFNSRAAFNAAAPGLPVEDFEEGNAVAGSGVPIESPLNSSTNDGFFLPGEILPGLTLQSSNVGLSGDLYLGGPGWDGNPSIMVGSNFFQESLNLLFSGTNAVGLDIGSLFSDSTIAVSIFGAGDLLLGSFNVAATGSGTFFGVVNDSGSITRINLNSLTGQTEWADNIAFGTAASSPVPEPATLSLLAVGLVGAAVRRFRRRK